MGLHIAWDGPRIYMELLLVLAVAYMAFRAFRV
jgi:hypothetical protein